MKSFIVAAMSADGFIAKNRDEASTSWTSQADKKHFIALTKKAGVIIMGAKTYETFGAKPLADRRNIIYSLDLEYENVETTTEPPEQLLLRLAQEGVSEVAICGGASIYTLFLDNNLVDKIYLTVEGVIFGQGLNLLSKSLPRRLSLVSLNKIGDNTVLLEYDLIK